MKTVFLRALEADDKATALLAAIHDPERASDGSALRWTRELHQRSAFAVCVLGKRSTAAAIQGARRRSRRRRR